MRSFRNKLINYGLMVSLYLRDFQVRDHVYRIRKSSAKLCKFKRRQHEQVLIDKLCTLHGESLKLYWNMNNQLKNEDRTGT